jgi:hypothetical protein
MTFFHVRDIVLAELPKAPQHHICSIGPDDAVRCILDRLRDFFQESKGLLVALSAQDFVEEVSDATESDTAWDALAAGLGMAKPEEH